MSEQSPSTTQAQSNSLAQALTQDEAISRPVTPPTASHSLNASLTWGDRSLSGHGLHEPRGSGTSTMQPPPSMDVDSDDEEEGDLPQYPNLEDIDSESLVHAARSSSAYGTPHRPNTSQNFPMGRSLKLQGQVIANELEQYPTTDRYYITKIYQNAVKDRNQIMKFVAAYKYFVNNAWKLGVPADPSKLREFMLYKPFTTIIAAIIKAFVTCASAKLPPGVDRKVHDTHNVQLQHKEGHHSSPDLTISAASSSFETPENGAVVGYSNAATVIDVKRDCDITKSSNIEQLSIYVRQIMAYQPNRKFVRCALLSEKRACLVHFDRSGVQISPFFDIHADVSKFIRMIVGLCSANESDLGLDTSIQWTTVDGKKTDGKLYTVGSDNKAKWHKLAHQHPISSTTIIRGRATTCWAVIDPDTGKEFIVKDSWVSAKRTSESVYLDRLKSLAGVCELVSFEGGRGQTKDYRCSTISKEYFNRVASRMMFEGYGGPLHTFTSVLQALVAVRDSIAGHARAYAKNILHRDIHNNNVLLGRDNAPEGSRGILIDFSVAVDYRNAMKVNQEARTSTRFFQSCSILDFLTGLPTKDATPPHDYLDDLESFFYLLCFLFLFFLFDGQERDADDPAITVVEGWDSENPKEALAAKTMLFSSTRRQRDFAAECILDTWGQECATLFEDYLDWVKDIQDEKARLVRMNRKHMRKTGKPIADENKSVFSTLFEETPKHYDTVLGLFNTAIDSITGLVSEHESLRDALAAGEEAAEPPIEPFVSAPEPAPAPRPTTATATTTKAAEPGPSNKRPPSPSLHSEDLRDVKGKRLNNDGVSTRSMRSMRSQDQSK